MTQTFKLSALLELEAVLARADAAGDRLLVCVVEEPLSDLEWDALERVPESREEIRDLLFAASRWSTNQTKPATEHALRLADAGNFGAELHVALLAVGAACVGDVEDSRFPRDIAANCVRALMRLRVIAGGRLARAGDAAARQAI